MNGSNARPVGIPTRYAVGRRNRAAHTTLRLHQRYQIQVITTNSGTKIPKDQAI